MAKAVLHIQPGDKKARGRKSQVVKEPESEQARR